MAREITIARENSVNPINARRERVGRFLDGYSHGYGRVTSADKRKIAAALKLDKMSAYELTEAGNDVAHYYAAKITDSDSSRRYTSSLRSVIEVINDLKYRKYGFV